MKEICREGNDRLLEYIPTMRKPLAVDFEPMRIVRRIRFWLEYLGEGHYKVFYLEHDGKLVGHCVVSPGGRRLKCSSTEDIVLGPYYISEEHRGKGYSKQMIQLVLAHNDFRYAFDWVEKENIASCRTSEACGFEKVGELNVSRWLRRLTIVEQGDDNIYRYQKSEISY